jgi:hypothetical protein
VDVFCDRRRFALNQLRRLRVEVRGLFSGNINVGRLYLRVYPECREGTNILRQIQRVLGRPETDLYLIGLFNFTDHLEAVEADALQDIIARWWDRPILTLDVNCLWHLGSFDDLVLDASVEEVILLG